MRLVAFEPDIPQNLGALIRIAACFGAGLDVIEPCGFPFSTKEVKRVAMDYAKLVELRAHTSWNAFLSDRPRRVILLTTQTKDTIYDYRFAPGDALLLGRESVGAPQAVHENADARLTIPIAPEARSLNVAVAAAIVLSEAQRQMRDLNAQMT